LLIVLIFAFATIRLEDGYRINYLIYIQFLHELTLAASKLAMCYEIILMKTFFIVLFVLVIGNICEAQNDTNFTSEKYAKIYVVADTMPSFQGGMDSLFSFIRSNLRYPTGTYKCIVYINFIVTFEGDLTRFKISQSCGKALDQEAIRIMKLMPRWNPGVKDGEKVNVNYNVTISF